jgi:SAM-dependent methyltransferase
MGLGRASSSPATSGFDPRVTDVLTAAWFPWEGSWPFPRFGPASAALAGCAAVLVLLMRSRIRQTLVIAAAFAVAWVLAAYGIPHVLVKTDATLQVPALLAAFGPVLLLGTVLWRIAIAVTVPRGAESAAEARLPSVPALRDLIRRMRAEPRPAGPLAPAPRAEGAAGVRSTVERAVAGAVAATLEQLRLAFRGPHVTEPPGTPSQVLWNRLMTQASGGVPSDERPEASTGLWSEFQATHLDPRIRAGGVVVCAGATPWPLAASLAESRRRVVVVERSRRTAEIAADDLRGTEGVTVIRHDGRSLDAVQDGSVDAVLSLFEPTLSAPTDLLLLLKECRRVLRKDGVAGIAFADLALPESREALARGSPAASFTNREAIGTLARLAGFGSVDTGSGALAWSSIAWMTA